MRKISPYSAGLELLEWNLKQDNLAWEFWTVSDWGPPCSLLRKYLTYNVSYAQEQQFIHESASPTRL